MSIVIPVVFPFQIMSTVSRRYGVQKTKKLIAPEGVSEKSVQPHPFVPQQKEKDTNQEFLISSENKMRNLPSNGPEELNDIPRWAQMCEA